MLFLLRVLNKPTHHNAAILISCLGKYETTFDQDTEVKICEGIEFGSLKWSFCMGMTLIYIVTSLNIVETFLIWKIIKATRYQTMSVQDMLSMTAFQRRQK